MPRSCWVSQGTIREIRLGQRAGAGLFRALKRKDLKRVKVGVPVEYFLARG
ncbi:MAG: hypothetical protein U0231_15070 [Nitrospiraceae bacterium]